MEPQLNLRAQASENWSWEAEELYQRRYVHVDTLESSKLEEKFVSSRFPGTLQTWYPGAKNLSKKQTSKAVQSSLENNSQITLYLCLLSTRVFQLQNHPL